MKGNAKPEEQHAIVELIERAGMLNAERAKLTSAYTTLRAQIAALMGAMPASVVTTTNYAATLERQVRQVIDAATLRKLVDDDTFYQLVTVPTGAAEQVLNKEVFLQVSRRELGAFELRIARRKDVPPQASPVRVVPSKRKGRMSK